MHSWRRPLFVLFLAAVLFSANLGGYDLWPADEPRFGQVAQEMLDSGNWLTPYVNGQPYTEKPPLMVWLIALFSLPLGEVTEWSARMPSMLAALATVTCTWALAARLFNPHAAFWAAMVLITTSRFWWQARTAQTDMLLTAAMALALLAFWMWHAGGRRARWLLVFYGAIAVGGLAKGPPALVFPLLLAVTFYWGRPGDRRQLRLGWGVAAAIAIVLAWFIPARMAIAPELEGGVQSGIAENLLRNTVGRLIFGVSKVQPPWYYLETLPADLLPWTIFLPWTGYWLWRRGRGEAVPLSNADADDTVSGTSDVQSGGRFQRAWTGLRRWYAAVTADPAMRLLLCWTWPALVFFSISLGKRAIYVLPLYPAFAILIAQSALTLSASATEKWRRGTGSAWAVVLLALGASPLAMMLTEYRPHVGVGGAVLSFCALAFAGDTLRRVWRGGAAMLHAAVAGHTAVISLLVAILAFPVINEFKSARAFCAPVRALAETGAPLRVYSIGFSREEYVFYSRHFHEPVLTDVLPIDPAETGVELSEADLANQQRRIRRALMEAVEQVDVEDLESITNAELAALEAAVLEVVHVKDVDDRVTAAYERALVEAFAAFAREFEQDTPAFAFVQTADWLWLLPLYPEARAYRVLMDRGVGRRDVLLLANQAAAERWGQLASNGEYATQTVSGT